VRVAIVTFLLLAIPFLGLEIVIRLLIATDRLATVPSHSDRLDIGLIHVRNLPPQDVLLMGDSQIATGFEPAVLRTLLGKELGRDVAVYNFGQPASTTANNQLLLEFIAREGRMPKVVIFDISLSSLVAPRTVPDPTASRPVADPDRPTLSNSALGRELIGCGEETEIVDRIDCELAHISAAWRWHGRPGRVMRAAVFGSQLRVKESRGKLRPDGFFARGAAPLARLEEQLRARDFEQRRITPGFNQRQADDFRAFAEAVEANGGTVIFVQVPLTRLYTQELASQNPDWEAQRRAVAEQLEAAIGRDTVYVESYGDWWTDRSASDLNHLSAEAAKDFTRQLWDMPDFRTPLIEGLDTPPG